MFRTSNTRWLGLDAARNRGPLLDWLKRRFVLKLLLLSKGQNDFGKNTNNLPCFSDFDFKTPTSKVLILRPVSAVNKYFRD